MTLRIEKLAIIDAEVRNKAEEASRAEADRVKKGGKPKLSADLLANSPTRRTHAEVFGAAVIATTSEAIEQSQ